MVVLPVYLKTDCIFYELGHPVFLHAFFSTISYRLEDGKWGTKYPHLMNQLYQGKLLHRDINDARNEVVEICLKLKKFEPSDVIWDIEDLAKRPPWGDKIPERIKDLSTYFETPDGRNYFDVLMIAFDDAETLGNDIEVTNKMA